MCGRYAIVSKVEEIQESFRAELKPGIAFKPSANVGAGKKGLVITQENKQEIQEAVFGFTPSWADKPKYILNARAEGDHNQDNSFFYSGAKGILEKPYFRLPIRRKRCLVIADAFYEGPEKGGLSFPHCVFLNNGRKPFAFAGVYDDWENPHTKEIMRSYAIVTTAAPPGVLQHIGHPRCPIILSKEREQLWLDPHANLSDITGILHPVDDLDLNAYPVSTDIKNIHADGSDLLKPLGDALLPQTKFILYQHIELFGMGETRAKKRRENEGPTLFDAL
jgi:putative SOS response-associated peptidase YedK